MGFFIRSRLAVLFFYKPVFGRSLELPNRGTSQKKKVVRAPSTVARVSADLCYYATGEGASPFSLPGIAYRSLTRATKEARTTFFLRFPDSGA